MCEELGLMYCCIDVMSLPGRARPGFVSSRRQYMGVLYNDLPPSEIEQRPVIGTFDFAIKMWFTILTLVQLRNSNLLTVLFWGVIKLNAIFDVHSRVKYVS